MWLRKIEWKDNGEREDGDGSLCKASLQAFLVVNDRDGALKLKNQKKVEARKRSSAISSLGIIDFEFDFSTRLSITPRMLSRYYQHDEQEAQTL